MAERLGPEETANKFVAEHFPGCSGALLAGSVVRGEGTDTSDLDIVVFDEGITSAYRESSLFGGWPIEVFVHNLSSYREFFRSDAKRARPSLIRMVSEGIPIEDRGVIDSIKKEAELLLKKGPDEWDDTTVRTKRYMITDALDDFIGAERDEGIFVAGALADLVHEFYLRTNRQWIGTSKWIPRALKQADPDFASKYIEAFSQYYLTGDKEKVVAITDYVLEPFGGRLFDGYRLG